MAVAHKSESVMNETPLDIQLFHKLVDEAALRGIPCRDLIRCLNAATPEELKANAKGGVVIMELMAKDGITHFMAARLGPGLSRGS
jgi:hypothetical protein